MRLPYGLGYGGHHASRVVLLASVVVAVFLRQNGVFALGVIAFGALEIIIFVFGRLEPDRRDPITAMQLRRYERQAEARPQR